ncbi:hypothetical protein TSUD_42010 [Trifolium subterraneum]|nr:hypothetical protein TSUD_42010 [Trifolium subterraneum]
MSGSRSRNNEIDSEEEGWASTFFKVAGAVATTAATGLYSILNSNNHRHCHCHHHQEQVILKVDGSVLRKVPSAGCGGYLSSRSQNWICGFVQKLKFTPNLKEHETEKEAILRGMRWVKNKGMRNVVVKSDCKNVVEFVNSGRRSNDRLICAIRDYLNCPNWQATLTWIRREENKVADKLADEAHNYVCFSLHQFQNRSDVL